MRPAGAVGDVIRRESMAQFVDIIEFFGSIIGRQHERQCCFAQLPDTRLEKPDKGISVAHLAVLPRGFEPGRMRKAAGGQR